MVINEKQNDFLYKLKFRLFLDNGKFKISREIHEIARSFMTCHYLLPRPSLRQNMNSAHKRQIDFFRGCALYSHKKERKGHAFDCLSEQFADKIKEVISG